MAAWAAAGIVAGLVWLALGAPTITRNAPNFVAVPVILSAFLPGWNGSGERLQRRVFGWFGGTASFAVVGGLGRLAEGTPRTGHYVEVVIRGLVGMGFFFGLWVIGWRMHGPNRRLPDVLAEKARVAQRNPGRAFSRPVVLVLGDGRRVPAFANRGVISSVRGFRAPCRAHEVVDVLPLPDSDPTIQAAR